MSQRQTYPAMPPRRDAKCEGCDVPYRHLEPFPGGARVVERHRLKMCLVAGVCARLCDKCRKLNRRAGAYRQALIKVKDAEAMVRAAQKELATASEDFLRPYAPREWCGVGHHRLPIPRLAIVPW